MEWLGRSVGSAFHCTKYLHCPRDEAEAQVSVRIPPYFVSVQMHSDVGKCCGNHWGHPVSAAYPKRKGLGQPQHIYHIGMLQVF